MIKKIIAAFAVAASMLCGINAFAAENPYETANAIARQTFSDLKANKDKLSDTSVVLEIIKKDLLPYVDIKYAAYKVIGTSLKTTSKEEREQFADAFGDYMMRSMSGAMGKYSNQELVESPVSEVAADASIVPVKFTVTEAGKPDINFIVKMRLNKKTGEWKAFDLVAENISILDAKQSELGPIIRDQGIAAAIKALNDNKAGK